MNTLSKASSFALAAAAAALLSGCGTMSGDDKAMEETAAAVEGKCYGVNSCKGHGACAGANNACAGQNNCKGQGWVKAMKSDCETKGGRFETT